MVKVSMFPNAKLWRRNSLSGSIGFGVPLQESPRQQRAERPAAATTSGSVQPR